jgi:8-oxo-dGTP pyrophosphatase MutT (NUDIX family)
VTSYAVAVGMIVAPDGRILLQQRDHDRSGGGMWGLVGGRVEPGETPAQAFLRETQEETGWRPRRLEPWLTRDVAWDGEPVRSHVFAAHLDVPPESLVVGEGLALELFPPDALPPDTVPGIDALAREFAHDGAYQRQRRHYEKTFAAGMIVAPDGRLLLQHRDDKPGIINPGKWATFGGHIEPYETPEDGFVREIEEELAWRPSRFERYWARPCACDGPEHLVYSFVAPLDVPPDALEQREGQGMGFFAPDALPEPLVPEVRLEVERLLAGGWHARAIAELVSRPITGAPGRS